MPSIKMGKKTKHFPYSTKGKSMAKVFAKKKGKKVKYG